MKVLKVLSIDWDYFFPDPSWFDWSHNEESSLLYEMVWATRPGTHNLKTGARAVNAFVPDRALLDGFWDRTIVPDHLIFKLVIAESHKTLGEELLKMGLTYDITNFDQHHDMGYDERPEMDCGNWAKHVLKACPGSTYRVVYPPWRKGEPEGSRKVPTSKPRRVAPDILFICRSSCWTPSWADEEWLKFTSLALEMDFDKGTTCKFVTTARQPDAKTAMTIADQFEEMCRNMQELNAQAR